MITLLILTSLVILFNWIFQGFFNSKTALKIIEKMEKNIRHKTHPKE